MSRGGETPTSDSVKGTGKPLFRELDPDDVSELETSEMESLCMTCAEMGTTRLLLTKIPMFREVIIMSFQCPHCGSSNSEIQPGAPVQDQGARFTLSVESSECLSVLVVVADTASVRIPELEFEIPPGSQKGCVTTVEGILGQAAAQLEQEQPLRKVSQPELAKKLEGFIVKLKECLSMKQHFTLVVDDPSGNSFVENQVAPSPNPHLKVEFYQRTQEQNTALSLSPAIAETDPTSIQPTVQESQQEEIQTENEEVISFETNCPNCHSPAKTRMKQVDIPHFKQVIVMATTCESCGHRTSEVKSGTGISEHGVRIQLKLTDPSDLSRDILKASRKYDVVDAIRSMYKVRESRALIEAETAVIGIPELEFEVQSGTLGGRFTTIEGLLNQVKEQLMQSNPFGVGDSAVQSKLGLFLEKLSEIIAGKRLGVHIVLDDPAGNSYIQNVYAPEPDPEMSVELYQRNYEQDEILGLNDMKTEGYAKEDSTEAVGENIV